MLLVLPLFLDEITRLSQISDPVFVLVYVRVEMLLLDAYLHPLLITVGLLCLLFRFMC